MFTFDIDESNLEREHSYSIEKLIVSTASIVLFLQDEPTEQRLCAKMWVNCDDKLYAADEPGEPTKYLLRGLEFNKDWAPGVYRGIAPIQLFAHDGKRIRVSDAVQNTAKTALLGPLIVNPSEKALEEHKEYAIVMVYLKEEWSLERQIHGSVGTQAGMEFLARKIAERHEYIEEAPLDAGNFSVIKSKLEDNLDIFHELVLRDHEVALRTHTTRFIMDALERNHEYFEGRKKAIKKCHGDLKVANLWVCSEGEATIESNASFGLLLALDCIDFKSAFYNIDVLSDIAMLAIDLEVHFAQGQKSAQEIQTLVDHFLTTYLRCIFGTAKELGGAIAWLLEYYMTEKAIVRTYMSMKYDHKPELGKQYLTCAYLHAEKLHISKE